MLFRSPQNPKTPDFHRKYKIICICRVALRDFYSSAATAFAASGLLDEVVHQRRTVTRRSALALGTKLLIEQETLKDGVTCEGEDAHENGTDKETDNSCDDAREVR